MTTDEKLARTAAENQFTKGERSPQTRRPRARTTHGLKGRHQVEDREGRECMPHPLPPVARWSTGRKGFEGMLNAKAATKDDSDRPEERAPPPPARFQNPVSSPTRRTNWGRKCSG